MALVDDIILDPDSAQAAYEQEMGYSGPTQMWMEGLTYDPTPETWDDIVRVDAQTESTWRFSGVVKKPTKFLKRRNRMIATAWEPEHTGVHYTEEQHGWACEPDCDKEHGWVEFVNPAESAVPAAYYYCLRMGIPTETLD